MPEQDFIGWSKCIIRKYACMCTHVMHRHVDILYNCVYNRCGPEDHPQAAEKIQKSLKVANKVHIGSFTKPLGLSGLGVISCHLVLLGTVMS